MARNDDTKTYDSRSHQTQRRRTGAAGRDRRRDKVIDTVKERPYTAAALATVAAGAAAFFLTRGKGDKPLMNWGQDRQDGHSPSSSAGKDAVTGGTSPSAVQAAALANAGTSTSASSTGGTAAVNRADQPTGTSKPTTTGKTSDGGKTGDNGLDAAAKEQTKAGSIAYGA
ncbi:hypothetical protein [Sphingomonas humi]|uniref:Uncharacterized protein n=1 Tax=Sphingomonas humi TaxID=335630 RepID=A0ABP7SBT4_9SPHN